MESTKEAQCSQAEYDAAKRAGLLFAQPGTNEFDAALHDFARAIEQAVLQSPGVQRLRRIAQALDYKIEAYERYGAICEFEGEPMIHASNLEEMRDAAMEKQ